MKHALKQCVGHGVRHFIVGALVLRVLTADVRRMQWMISFPNEDYA